MVWRRYASCTWITWPFRGQAKSVFLCESNCIKTALLKVTICREKRIILFESWVFSRTCLQYQHNLSVWRSCLTGHSHNKQTVVPTRTNWEQTTIELFRDPKQQFQLTQKFQFLCSLYSIELMAKSITENHINVHRNGLNPEIQYFIRTENYFYVYK